VIYPVIVQQLHRDGSVFSIVPKTEKEKSPFDVADINSTALIH